MELPWSEAELVYYLGVNPEKRNEQNSSEKKNPDSEQESNLPNQEKHPQVERNESAKP